MEPVDDHLLAGFLAGTLTSEQRHHVVEYLARNADAREVLRLASSALDTVMPAADAPGAPAARPERAPVQRAVRRAPALGRYAVLTALVLTTGALLRVTLGPPADQLRSTPAQVETTVLRLRVLDGARFRWNAVAGATRYEVVVWDPAEATVVARADARGLEPDAAFAAALGGRLRAGHAYSARVDAFDDENRLLLSSDLLAFTR